MSISDYRVHCHEGESHAQGLVTSGSNTFVFAAGSLNLLRTISDIDFCSILD